MFSQGIKTSEQNSLEEILPEFSSVERQEPAVSTEEKNYSCEHCTKSFISSSCLQKHKCIQKGKKAFSFSKCENCGKSFTSVSNLNRHKRIHTGEKPYSCKHCGKSFTYSSNLKKHKCIHNHKEKKVSSVSKCENCGKSFTSVSNLSRHKRIHAGEKPYSCRYCLKSFSDLFTPTKT